MRQILLFPFLFMVGGSTAQPRVVHVVVALCDNVNQGIVKVPAGIGNGQKPSTNLYWGAGYGVKTHFDRSSEWVRLKCGPAEDVHILDRAVWKHRDSAVYLVADAYDGKFIREATEDLLRYASGADPVRIQADGRTIAAGGSADLIAYVGHDGLMDFALSEEFPATDRKRRETIILACISKRYFAEPLRSTGASPLLWTTGLMAPEAYTLRAALEGWVRGETAAAIDERAAVAYNTYQKCGLTGARRLFATGW
ncbi:MAG TPA: hypothetical protein VKG92_11670 [Flavobacteriales bacterium]|nr:hypothetical protein [Flavobacteriales bacterium]